MASGLRCSQREGVQSPLAHDRVAIALFKRTPDVLGRGNFVDRNICNKKINLSEDLDRSVVGFKSKRKKLMKRASN